jgi:hypothetical protein
LESPAYFGRRIDIGSNHGQSANWKSEERGAALALEQAIYGDLFSNSKNRGQEQQHDSELETGLSP